MRWIDGQGRLFGRLNVIDLVIVVLVCVLTALAYSVIVKRYRTVSPYPLSSNTGWVRTELRLTPERAVLQSFITPGLKELSVRNGLPVAEILLCSGTPDGGLLVSVRLCVSRDKANRIYYEGTPLLPGRSLRINTNACIIEGFVASTPVPETDP